MRNLLFIAILIGTFAVGAKRRPAHFALSNGNQRITIIGKGKQKQFDLDIPRGFEFEAYESVQNDEILVFFFQYSDFDSAASKIMIFDKKSLKLLWQKELDGFNLVTPLIYKDYLYFSTLGAVYKYKLRSGKPVWEHTGLLKSHNFVAGEEISVKGALVQFGKNVVVEDKTGRIFGGDR